MGVAMSNSIRTPRQGISETSQRIAQAVDDEEWQEFRVSLKGQSTQMKISRLVDYYCKHGGHASTHGMTDAEKFEHESVKIRVDNYIKALCRGGQLYPGCDFAKLFDAHGRFIDGWIKR